MDLKLHPIYKTLLLLAIVLGPIVWLVFTQDGQRRTDLVILYLLGKGELNLAIEKLHPRMSEDDFRRLFPDLDLACRDAADRFGDRICSAEVGAFNGVPSRSFTLFLRGDRLRAAKLHYRRVYHETLRRQLEGRLGMPAAVAGKDAASEGAPVTWVVDAGLLLLPPARPESGAEAALMWLSRVAIGAGVDADSE